MKTITLTVGEMMVAQLLATMRTVCARGNHVADAKMGEQSAYQTDLEGAVAELAFAKWWDIYPELSVSPRSGGFDFVIRGVSVDVKGTRYQKGKLLATLKKSNGKGADVYVLGIVTDNVVVFPGWAKSSELINEANIKDLGRGPGYVLDQSRLHPWPEKRLR